MQKKIIALAIAASFSAPAFADTTTAFYGIVDGSVARISATGQKSDLLALSGGASGSRLGVKVTEDLDNGMKAVAVLEYGLDTENSDGLNTTTTTARQKMLALAGGFGTIATGHLQTAGYDFAGKFDPIAGSAVSPLQSMTKPTNTFLIGTAATAARAQRAIAYISPNMNGLTVAVNYATALAGLGDLTAADNATTGLKTSAYLMSGTYTRDALTVGGVYAATSNSNTGGASLSEFAFGGSYNLGIATVMGTYQSGKSDATGAKANTALSLSAVMPIGANAIAVTYAKSTIAEDSALGGSGFTAGYLHTLSKTTTGYAAFSSVTNGSGTSAFSVGNNAVAASTAAGWTAGGGSSNLIAVGLRKKF